MGVFNYSRFHYFDKNGEEIILSHKPRVKVQVLNKKHPKFFGEYALVNSVPYVGSVPANSSLLTLDTGMRFNLTNEVETLDAVVTVNDPDKDKIVQSEAFIGNFGAKKYSIQEYPSSFGIQNYPVFNYNDTTNDVRGKYLDSSNLGIDGSIGFFPTYTFNAKMEFDKVSTGLVETQAIYVLVENEFSKDRDGRIQYTTVKEYIDYRDGFQQVVDNNDASIGELTELLNEINPQIEQLRIQIEEAEARGDNPCPLYDRLNPLLDKQHVYTTEIEDFETENEELQKKIDKCNDAYDFVSRFDLFFFVDCREQKDFRMFDVEYDELTWSDRAIIDFSQQHNWENSNNGYSVNIGFSGENDGVYEEKLYVCLIDRCNDEYVSVNELIDNPEFKVVITDADDKVLWGLHHDNTTTNIDLSGMRLGDRSAQSVVDSIISYYGYMDVDNLDINNIQGTTDEVYPIGEVNLLAEAEGEDERYRTFFKNFGVPDPKEYNDIFNDSDINDDLPNYESINKHSKQLFLAYSEIFPYVGSYKALINAVKLLGYENEIFFKEWYKEIGNAAMDDSGYTTFDISLDGSENKNTIEKTGVSERIHLRKMNWISMVYHINEELDKPEDMFGFPEVITKYENFNIDKLAKLISLKNWIDRYATGVNCHIIDVSGEGLVFERYSQTKYGSYQTVLDYNNEKSISPILNENVHVLEGGEAGINVDIYTNDKLTTIEDIKDTTFRKYCDGYFGSDNVFRLYDKNLGDNSDFVYFGKTFNLFDNLNTFQVRAKGTHETFRFDHKLISGSHGRVIAYEYICAGPSIIVENDDIIFDGTELKNSDLNSVFRNMPTIQIEKGTIKRYKQSDESNETLEYFANIYDVNDQDGTSHYEVCVKTENDKKYRIDTIPTFVPPTITGMAMSPDKTLIPFSCNFIDDQEAQKYYIDAPLFADYNISPLVDGSNIYGCVSHNGTYGLRYCVDNVTGIPCFKMMGYEEKHLVLNSVSTQNILHVPDIKSVAEDEGYEYIVDILDGRMLFVDNVQDLYVSLNFKYDEQTGKRRIYVTTFSVSEQKSMYTYKDLDYIKRFIPSNVYRTFVNGYKNSADDVISYNLESVVTVHHAGDYQIDAIMYDDHNNVFAKTASQQVTVLTQAPDVELFVDDVNAGDVYGSDMTVVPGSIQDLINTYISTDENAEIFLGYDNNYRIKQLNKTANEDNDTLFFCGLQCEYNDTLKTDDGTALVLNKKDVTKIIVTSLSNKVKIAAADCSFANGYIFTLIKKSTNQSHIFANVDEGFNNIGIQKTSSLFDDLITLHGMCDNSIINSTPFDAILVMYDRTTDTIENEFLGTYLPTNAYYESVKYDEYKFLPKVEGTGSGTPSNILSWNMDREKYDFYLIPRWALRCDVQRDDEGLIIRTMTKSGSTYSYPFENNLDDDTLAYLYFKQVDSKYYADGLYDMFSVMDSGIERGRFYSSKNIYETEFGEQTPDGWNKWYSPSDLKYSKYIFDVSTGCTDISKEKIVLVKNNNYDKNKLFVDHQLAVSLRNFDPDDAKRNWIDDSLDLSRSFNGPIVTNKETILLTITTDDDQLDDVFREDMSNMIMVRWKVYKRIGENERTLLFEVYNKCLPLTLDEYGVYDIEVDLFDNYGNKYSKKIPNAITYRK